MRRKKTSKKQGFSFKEMPVLKMKNREGILPWKGRERLRDKELVAHALWECLVANDTKAFKDILRSHVELTSKDNLAKKAGISKRTLYRMLSPSGNPTLENLGKIIHELCA